MLWPKEPALTSFSQRVLNGANQWPPEALLPNFRPIVSEYHNRCEALGRRLVKLICKMLGADESYMTRYFEDVQDPTDL